MADADEADIVNKAVTYNGWYGASRHRGRGWQLRSQSHELIWDRQKTQCLRETE